MYPSSSDCDSTLVDSQHIMVAAMTHAFHANGLELPMRRPHLPRLFLF
jgi:beta-phosphoglucomutase-like phosphatase (HAD superfamily)